MTPDSPLSTPKPDSAGLSVEALMRQLDASNRKTVSLEQRIRFLELELRLLRIKHFGASSEKLSDGQLELMEAEPSVEKEEIEKEAALLPEAKAEADRQVKRSRLGIHPGREPLPAHLPRIEQIIPCSPEMCHCGQCGGENKVIGHERTEVLDVEPARYFVRVLLREKRACPLCEEMGVATAVMPVRIVEKGKLSDAVVVDSLVRKYGEHTPLYRQLAGLEREAGVILSPATFNAGVMRCGDLLAPVIEAMREALLGGGYIQADETPVGVRSDLKKGRNHQGYIFEYSRPKADVVYDFQMSRGRAGPESFLKKFEGVLQTDGYTGYDQVGAKGGIVHAACMAHVRRKFHEAHLIAKSDPLPREIIESIAALYALETCAREEKMDAAARLSLRQAQSAPLAKALKERLVEIRAAVLPKSALGKACSYALGMWPRLEVFLRDGRVEIDNNWCENGMRPLALGRKNWLHIGSPEAGIKIAAIASIFETCKRHDINVREYLLDALPRIADWPSQRIAELTPLNWKKSRPA
jgi:transposase